MNTKIKIIESALALFNEKGSYGITTNHIAEKAGISPGNLYYHFKNKEEIIREIFWTICNKFEEIWPKITSFEDVNNLFYKIIKEQSELYYSYRFFYIELTTLLSKDSILKTEYVKNYESKVRQYKNSLMELSGKGVLNFGRDSIDGLIRNAWIISEFWPSFLITTGKKISQKNLEKVFHQLFHLYLPYNRNLNEEKI